MDVVSLTDLVEFSPDGPQRVAVAQSDRLYAQLICLERAQETESMSDPGSDAVLAIVAGEVVVFVDRSRKRLTQWATALIPAGSGVVIRNASEDPAVVLLIIAPPPTA